MTTKHCLFLSLSGENSLEEEGAVCYLLSLNHCKHYCLCLACIILPGKLENQSFQFVDSAGNDWEWQ